jgi:hypothetical protein
MIQSGETGRSFRRASASGLLSAHAKKTKTKTKNTDGRLARGRPRRKKLGLSIENRRLLAEGSGPPPANLIHG